MRTVRQQQCSKGFALVITLSLITVVSVASGTTLDLQNWSYGETELSLGGLNAGAGAIVVDGGTIKISGTTPTSYQP